jgi:hypothetical protein
VLCVLCGQIVFFSVQILICQLFDFTKYIKDNLIAGKSGLFYGITIDAASYDKCLTKNLIS